MILCHRGEAMQVCEQFNTSGAFEGALHSKESISQRIEELRHRRLADVITSKRGGGGGKMKD